jgi:ABC-type lipoprotein release transport system permease subunit
MRVLPHDLRYAFRSLRKSPGFASVAALLAAVGFLASAIPARRAVRVDPISALREE